MPELTAKQRFQMIEWIPGFAHIQAGLHYDLGGDPALPKMVEYRTDAVYQKRGPKARADWRRKAVELRLKCWTYDEIGEECGVTGERVRQVLNEDAPHLTGRLSR